MLRVIRTELYFNPFDIKWRFPELVVSNPGISMAFFGCDPSRLDFEKIFSTPVSPMERVEPPQVLRAFFDTALQNAPFNTYGFQAYHELNKPIIDEIYNEPIIIEHSPAEGIPLGKLLSGASVATIGTYVGLQGVWGNPLLFVAVPAGIIVVGAAVAVVRAFDKGLNHAVERAIGSKDKPVDPTPTLRTGRTIRPARRRRA
jgi:hypothetical protein